MQMKSYTDIEQSRKLAEILPLESADMWFHPYPNDEYWYDVPNIGNADLKYNQLPCWSLASLIDVLPADWWGYTDHYFLEINQNSCLKQMRCSINPEKCEFASNMKDRPSSRCLKYDDAANCPKCLKARKKQSKHSKQAFIKSCLENYDFDNKKVQAYLKKQKSESNPIVEFAYPDTPEKKSYLNSCSGITNYLVLNGIQPYPEDCYPENQRKLIYHDTI
jgi:hypothetical protein